MTTSTLVRTAVEIKTSQDQVNGNVMQGMLQHSDMDGAQTSPLLGDVIDLSVFRQTSSDLSRLDRLRIVQQALILIEKNYVHLPLKVAMHAANPVQRLKLLADRLQNISDGDLEPELSFHHEMITIFMSVRDLHTNYILPAPYNEMVAFLPFLIEEYYLNGERHYLVSHVADGIRDGTFEPGVEVMRLNGIPIERAVVLNGNLYAGSNLEARRARGVEMLTVRPLLRGLPPEEDHVIVEYRTLDGYLNELRVPWQVFSPNALSTTDLSTDSAELQAVSGIDVELKVCRDAKKHLFAPHIVEQEQQIAEYAVADETELRGLESTMPSVIEAETVQTPSGTFGYVRIRTFSVNDYTLIREFMRLVAQLPKDGLIIDVRGNGGGLIWASERLLQLLTPRPIEPELFQFINTPLNLMLCEQNASLSLWKNSIRDSIRSGATYSRGFSLTTTDQANNIGQRYHGPVVLITDALCYSATDMFAAGFQDHQIGIILGVHKNTGAGGANVWAHDLLLQRFLPPNSPGSPYQSLPKGAGLRVAIRRSLRTGALSGTPVEDFGVVPDVHHEMTRDDLLNGNVDLINHAGELLASLPKRILHGTVIGQNEGDFEIKVITTGMTRLDIYADDRPIGSVDVSDGETILQVTAGTSDLLELRGFDAGHLVAAFRLTLM